MDMKIVDIVFFDNTNYNNIKSAYFIELINPHKRSIHMDFIKNIKEKLNSEEYSFLKTHQNLGDHLLLLTTAGSIAYGTNVESSDTDVRGVTLERKQDIMGLSSFDQFQDVKTDTVIYSLKKFIKLCLSCNPNVIEILGTRNDHILHMTDEGKLLRDNAHLFLSKKAIESFGNYATAQLRRLQNALARDNYPQAEKEEHILNSVLGQMEHLKRTYSKFTGNDINVYIDKSHREDMDTEIFIDVNMKHYPLRDLKNIYSEMSNIVKDYSKLNHRNSKKDELHLNKHAMHLIRLLVTGTEILEGKGINTYREKEKSLFLDIRNGKFTYKEIFMMVDQYEAQFKYASKNTPLPDDPHYEKVEELMLEIYKNLV